ncbi:MAG: hypothetical protein MI919_36875, partial [Holophagales bacterium]|nr:hypothetical protein [Holophagales bacterium]
MAPAATPPVPAFPFLGRAGRILNSGQARTLVVTGNVHDLFWVPSPEAEGSAQLPESRGAAAAPAAGATGGDWVPIVDFLRRHWSVPGKILLVYELNGPIRFPGDAERERVKDAWLRWRTGVDLGADELAIQDLLAVARGEKKSARAGEVERLGSVFDSNLVSAIGKPTVALELLRQLCLCSRYRLDDGRQALEEDLIILVEAADLAVPDGEIRSLSDADRRRLAICQDWFSDPGFLEARDSVVLLAESRSLVHHRLARLPQILEVEIPAPDLEQRRAFISWFEAEHGGVLDLDGDGAADGRVAERPASTAASTSAASTAVGNLAELTAGLSLHALSQLLKGAAHGSELLSQAEVVHKVEDFVRAQLGDDVVEIKKPSHRLDAVVGFTALEGFLRRELIPRFRDGGVAALPGAAVAGPIGSGKTFIFEAVAA